VKIDHYSRKNYLETLFCNVFTAEDTNNVEDAKDMEVSTVNPDDGKYGNFMTSGYSTGIIWLLDGSNC